MPGPSQNQNYQGQNQNFQSLNMGLQGQDQVQQNDEAEPDVFQVEPVSVPEDTGASGETSGEGAGEVISCSREF